MHHCAQTFAQMNIWLQSSEYCNAVKWNVSGWYKIVQYSRKGCNCKVQCSTVGMDAIANCAPQSLSLSQTCKLGQIGAWQDFGPRFVCLNLIIFLSRFQICIPRFMLNMTFFRICICLNQFKVSKKYGVFGSIHQLVSFET